MSFRAFRRLPNPPSFSSFPSFPSVKLIFLLPLTALAEPSVRLELGEERAWTGQRLPFYIELRADGSFTGAASFDLPTVPKTVILKVGNPVLGSLTEGDVEYFTQRHEFALFSQSDGSLELPPITVRFSSRKGYTGPSFDHALITQATPFAIERPPGSAELGFLVTTPSLRIEESWEPTPGPLEVGAVLKRTITQEVVELTGMALAPPRAGAPEGIRVYPGEPEVADRTERGSLSARRRDVITYLVQKPGTYTLPELRYNWWNPKSERLESKTLPAVSFVATAPPAPPPPPSPFRFVWFGMALVLVVGLAIFRKHLRRAVAGARDRLDPPERRIRRAFLRACRRNDAAAASRLWTLVATSVPEQARTEGLATELIGLQRHLYGRNPDLNGWNGAGLACAFQSLQTPGPGPHPRPDLPPLNL